MMEGIGQLNYYVRDASGKVLAIYNGDGSQAEVPIYGASRLGIRFNDELTSYQLSDHLGNVRATVSWSGVSRSINNYSDFYPFGMKIGYQTDGKYRYGYQGEFAEDETDETGFNSFEARMYDPVIGRWMSVDPARQYASGYVGMGNNPVMGVDPDGRECTTCPKGSEYDTYRQSNLVYNYSKDIASPYIALNEVSITANPVEMGVINSQSDGAPIAWGLLGMAGGAAAASYGILSFNMVKNFAIDYSFQNIASLVNGNEKNVDVFDASLSMIPDNKYTIIPKVVAGAFINVKENGGYERVELSPGLAVDIETGVASQVYGTMNVLVPKKYQPFTSGGIDLLNKVTGNFIKDEFGFK